MALIEYNECIYKRRLGHRRECAWRRDHWGPREKVATCNPRREPQQKPIVLTPWFWSSRLHNCEKLWESVCCFSQPVCENFVTAALADSSACHSLDEFAPSLTALWEHPRQQLFTFVSKVPSTRLRTRWMNLNINKHGRPRGFKWFPEFTLYQHKSWRFLIWRNHRDGHESQRQGNKTEGSGSNENSHQGKQESLQGDKWLGNNTQAHTCWNVYACRWQLLGMAYGACSASLSTPGWPLSTHCLAFFQGRKSCSSDWSSLSHSWSHD